MPLRAAYTAAAAPAGPPQAAPRQADAVKVGPFGIPFPRPPDEDDGGFGFRRHARCLGNLVCSIDERDYLRVRPLQRRKRCRILKRNLAGRVFQSFDQSAESHDRAARVRQQRLETQAHVLKRGACVLPHLRELFLGREKVLKVTRLQLVERVDTADQ